eukprot:jgi/Chlat1/7569/Chrsp63S07084
MGKESGMGEQKEVYVYRFVRPQQGRVRGAGDGFDCPFAEGDYVVLSTESGLPAVASGTITSLTQSTITLSLRKRLRLPPLPSHTPNHTHPPATQHSLLLSERWRLDRDETASHLALMRANLVKLFVAGEHGGDAKRRRLVVDLETPGFDAVGNDGGYNNMALNEDQRSAVAKTTTIVECVRALLARGKSVLLTSYTNTAVDNVLLKLKRLNVDFLRVGRANMVHPDLQTHTLAGVSESVAALEAAVGRAHVVACTCLGITHPLFSKRKFDVCIVDEASQITLPVCLGPLRYADAFVLVGDHYQLPPLVKDPQAREGGMATSLFRRLSEAHPQSVVGLECQLIYAGRLRCGSHTVASGTLALPTLTSHALSLPSADRNWLTQRVLKGAGDGGGLLLNNIECHTIDKYQGRDKECVVVSFVRSNEAGVAGSLLEDWRRINVAITRAKYKLVLIGSCRTLSSVPLLRHLINMVDERRWRVDPPPKASIACSPAPLSQLAASKCNAIVGQQQQASERLRSLVARDIKWER